MREVKEQTKQTRRCLTSVVIQCLLLLGVPISGLQPAPAATFGVPELVSKSSSARGRQCQKPAPLYQW